MKISFWSIGKANEQYVKAGVEEFTKRIGKYFKADWILLPVPKNAGMLSEMDLRKREAETIFEWLDKDDWLVALDGRGKEFSSEELAKFMQLKADKGVKKLVFVIGGVYGLDEEVIKKADQVWSLSNLTFPHQLVRLILAEQVYRACTILRNEKYHHK